MHVSDRPVVGRDQLLSQMRQRLEQSGRVVVGQPDEHGGNGRTTVVHQYAERFHEDSGRTFRLRCDAEGAFRAGLVEIATSLGLPERFARQPGDPLSGLLLWLQSEDDWLLILDDVQLWEYAEQLINAGRRGHIIIIPSTAAPPHLEMGDSLAMPRFTLDESAACLSAAAGEIAKLDQKLMHRIADYCGRHALSISLMSGAMRGTQRDPAELLRELIDVAPLTTAEIPALDQSAVARIQRRLCRLVEYSVAQCSALSPLAEFVLRACSFLDSERISAELLARLLDRKLAAEEGSLRRSLSILTDFGLLVESDLSGEYLIHPQVQSVLRDQFKGCEDRAIIMPALIEGLIDRLEQQGIAPPERQLSLTLHAHAVCSRLTRKEAPVQAARVLSLTANQCADMGATGPAISLSLAALNLHWSIRGENDPLVADELERVANFYRQHQQYRHARRGYRQTLSILRAQPFPDSHRILHLTLRLLETDLSESLLDRARSRLERAEIQLRRLDHASDEEWGALLSLRGSYLLGVNAYEEAISALETSLRLLSGALAEDDPQLLKVRTVLGRAYFAAEKYGDAERILREDLRIRDASESIGESNTAVPTNLLGELYLGQGRFAEAEPLFERVLRVREATLGPNHRLVGEVANRLAVVKGSRGDYRTAEPLFRRTLTIHESVYGVHHPEVARVLNDLAEMLYAQAKHDPARRLLERALMIQQKRLRHTDAQLARTRNNLAAVYVAKGLYEEAEFQFQRDLDAKRNAREPNRPGIATALNNLGDVWRAQGRYSSAEDSLREALALREESLGDQHPLVAQSQSNLGYVLLQRRKLDQAAKLFEKSLAIRERCLSPIHPHIAATLNNLAEVRLRQRQFDTARLLLDRSLEICRKVYGEQSAQSAAVYTLLGRVELQGGSQAKAEWLLLKARGIQNLRLVPQHRHRARNAMALSELYLREGRQKEAEELLVAAAAHLRDQPGGNPLEIAEAQLLLGRLYFQSGRNESAESLLRQCLSTLEQCHGPDHPQVAECLSELGAVLHKRKASHEAERLLARALSICDIPAGWDRPAVDIDLHGETLGRMAEVCCELNHPERAEELRAKQQRLAEATLKKTTTA